jgi:hypothetical protein
MPTGRRRLTLQADGTPALRDDMITYLLCTSPDRARIVAELGDRGNVGVMSLLMDLEEDDALRNTTGGQAPRLADGLRRDARARAGPLEPRLVRSGNRLRQGYEFKEITPGPNGGGVASDREVTPSPRSHAV